MKIAFIHFWTLRLRRGVETLVLSLANELTRQGADVSVLTARQSQVPLISPARQVRVKSFPTFRYYESTTIVPFYLADMIRERYDIVIAFFADFGEGWALNLAWRLTNPRLFLYLTFPYESAPHRYHAYQRFGWTHKAACILADAEYTARGGEAFFKRPIQLMPSGTDPHRFCPDPEKRDSIRRRLGFADNEIILLNVAALEKRKGAWRVLEALPDITPLLPNVRYLILGDGSEKPALERRVEELGLDRRVLFAGTTDDLPPYYDAADIFVMLPDAEAGSIACLEAMASGLPVVVSTSGGFREVVSKENGRTVPLDSQKAFVDAIVELGADRALREKLGSAARRTTIERFSWERIAERLYSLCIEVCERGRRYP